MPAKNPFGEESSSGRRVNPFGEAAEAGNLVDSLNRIEHAARAVRRLKQQLGAEGLTLAATRELIDEVSQALDATARALRSISDER
jgi:hypothetical protein